MSGRIAVVGGGLAGIGAALAAADAGADVVLLERRQFLGGLTTSVVRRGLSFDNGQHVFLRCCTAYLEFLRRLGAEADVYLQPRLDIPVFAPGRPCARIRRSSLPAPLHLCASLAAYSHLPLADRARIGRAALGLRRLDPDDPALDARSFAEWLSSRGQSERAIERLWNLIALPTLNLPAHEASLALAARVFRVGLLDRSDGGDVGWSKIPLAELHGVKAGRALEAAGVEVLLGRAVEAIGTQPGGSFRVGTRGCQVTADAVIVATPPRVAAPLVEPLAAAVASCRSAETPVLDVVTAALLGASPIVNVHLVLDRRVIDVPIAACIDSPIQFLFDRTSSSGVAAPGQCLSISLSAAESYVARGSVDLVSEFFHALGEIFPAARGARLLDAVVTRERAATFRGTPGSRVLRPSERTGVAGLFLAGAWCATGWPATMEGALRSGAAAASASVDFVSGGGQRDSEASRRRRSPRHRTGSSHPAETGTPLLEEAMQ